MNLKNTIVATSLLLTTSLAFAQEAVKEKEVVAVAQPETPKVKEVVAPAKPEKQEPLFNVKFSGFIRHDAMYDSRQTVDVREAEVMLWPKDVSWDANGEDRNAAPQFQMLDILSRIGVRVNGPDVLGAKIGGFLEGDFFGNAEAGINEFRLRHAWITLDWDKTQLGIGQYWHPLTIPEIFPGVVNFSGGAPYMPYNRNPQIRLTQKINDFNLLLAVVSQRDFTSNTAPYRNSALPSGHVQMNYKTKNLIVGLASHFEQLRPKLSSGDANNVSNERVNSISVMAYTRLETKPVTIKAEAVYGENAASFIMLGGFIGYTLPDQIETYTTMSTQSYWIDFTGKTKRIIPGFFAGFSKNEGGKDVINSSGAKAKSYGFASTVGGIGAGAGARTINYIYRLAPRVEMPFKKLKFGLELEYSVAEWGDADNSGRAVANLDVVANTRVLFSTTFTF
jgi:hypothetical protein